ncbi:matrixin family metalloprotease [Aliishimia ponticola]|uniref:Matrixin family metalloprotease n=1 Tax=Aliishimia ponticola TaxID=2499833 RepID=A0A4S4NC79_9RHOB|nr:pre-peptidase C-terminal domain-containing protein [Aliishimia ponticola]THH35641.1 matrixin family metalloprotease [Aliishimia ponticola]
MCLICGFSPSCDWSVPQSDVTLGAANGPTEGDDAAFAAELGESRIDAAGDTSTDYAISGDSGDTFEGFIGDGDVDFIEVTLTGGNDYEFGVTGDGTGELADPLLKLYDADGNLLDENDDFAPGSTAAGLVFSAVDTGSYFVSVEAADDGVGGYALVATRDASDTLANATSLGRFGVILSVLSQSDVDTYRIDGYSTAFEYTIGAYGVGSAGAELPILTVMDEAGTVIGTNESGGSVQSAFVDVDPEVNGAYYVQVTMPTGAEGGVYEIRSLAEPQSNLSSNWFVEPEYYYPFALGMGDIDVLFVDLEAGNTYGVEAFSRTYGEADTFLRLRDDAGNLIADNDDESADSSNAYVSFTAEYSGRYYIEMSLAAGSEEGLVGLSVQNLTTASPVEAITWQDAALPTDDRVTVFFAAAGQTVNDVGQLVVSDGFTQDERQEIMALLRHVSDFADIEFVQTSDAGAADIQIAVADLSSFGYSDNLIGQARPAGSTFYSDGVVLLDDDYWTETALARGGFMNHVILHELGHAIGLAHPHDYGGDSRPFVGVRDESDLGDFDLNQVPYTAMTYNDFWDGLGDAEPEDLGSGFLWGFGSLDMIALQDMYGANTDYRSGNTDYVLGEDDYLMTIWDTGGIDRIRYGGSDDVVIDLRAAEGDYSEMGGGGISYVEGGLSGFVIARDVELERILGGAGDDVLTGNAADNKIEGRNGSDILRGGAGDDLLIGGLGSDQLEGDAGADMIYAGSGHDTVLGGAGDDILYGNRWNDLIDGGDGDDTLYGGQHDDILIGGMGNDILDGGTGNDVFKFGHDEGTDLIVGFDESDLIDLSGLGLTYAGLLIDTSLADAEYVIFGTNVLTFSGLMADLDETDFLFV